MFRRKQLRGVDLLDSVVAQFDTMVTDLLAASAQINADVQATQEEMDRLRAREASLINAEARAHRVRENLEKLVS